MAEVSVLIWGMVAKRTKMPIGTRRVSEANQKESSCEDLLEKVLARDNLLTAWTATVRSTRKMA